jgi:hypothetical protein
MAKLFSQPGVKIPISLHLWPYTFLNYSHSIGEGAVLGLVCRKPFFKLATYKGRTPLLMREDSRLREASSVLVGALATSAGMSQQDSNAGTLSCLLYRKVKPLGREWGEVLEI